MVIFDTIVLVAVVAENIAVEVLSLEKSSLRMLY